MDELIRKQDALDAFNGEITVAAARNAGRVYTYLKMVTDRIKALPPVHVPVMNVGDMISRQAAMDALYHVDEYNARSIEAIKNLPSVQPETCEGCKHLGKWANEVEYGYPSPCTCCKRRVDDHYER